MNILVLNCGSSSLKFQLIETNPKLMAVGQETLKASGLVERIGSQALLSLKAGNAKVEKSSIPIKTHEAAVEFIFQWLINHEPKIPGIENLTDIHAVGHRIVHGGERFSKSILITDEIQAGIEDCIDLAPLHNPANLAGIMAVRKILGDLPQVAVFDTAFHSSMPEKAFLYAIPYHFYRRYKVRRYGFHGTSHRYVTKRYEQLINKSLENSRLITLHLGNGCSACAVQGGKSVSTSMGLTPLEGMVMGTRSGDLDPAVLNYLADKEGLSLDQLESMLNKDSGLLGISGLTSDMRELLEEESENHDRRAQLAIDMFVQGVRKYIGAYLVELGGTDALIFAGGIGENSPLIRQRICQDLGWAGLVVDDALNDAAIHGFEGNIAAEGSKIQVYVIPTNEELLIARDTAACLVSLIA